MKDESGIEEPGAASGPQATSSPSDKHRQRLTLTHAPNDDADELDQRPLDFGIIRRMFTYTRPHASKRNRLMLAVIVRAIQLPCLGWLMAYIINGPIADGNLRGLFWGMVGYLALAVWTCIHFHFRQRWALELGEAVVHDLRRDIFQHLHSLSMSYFHRTKLGRTISRMTSDVEAVRVGMQDVLFICILCIFQMTAAAIFILYYDWAMFIAVAATAPVLWYFNRYFRQQLSRRLRGVQESFSKVSATIAESVSGIRVTQGFVRQDVNAGVFSELVALHGERNVGVARIQGVFLPMLEINTQTFIAVLLVLGGYRVLFVGVSPQVLVECFFMAAFFFDPVVIMGNMYNQALASMAGAERVFNLLDKKPDFVDPPDAVKLLPMRGHVELRDLTFGYDANHPVLHNISFIAEPGKTIALVGHTGSGKSSIINLIAKFYLPTSGLVLIDGHDIDQIDAEVLHKQMGIVLQVNFLFTGSVMENIRVGKSGATDDQVIDAARKLNCLDLLQDLPQGLQTVVGERGQGLSLGQRQLVCFCRAMLADPKIFILDEATSSVDTITESRLQTALRLLMKGRTCFVVAHRLSTIRHADLVLVMEDGRIVERGNHNELVVLNGVYANLYRQFVTAASRKRA